MARKYLILFIICLPLVSCNLIRGKPVYDADLGGEHPIVIDKDQIGFGEKRLPKKARWYRVYWGALTVGDIYVLLLPTQEGYGMRTAIRSRGIAKLISQWQGDSGATMNFIEPDKYRPTRFKTSFQLRNRKRQIDIHWGENGKIIKETNVPPENRNKREEVSEEAKLSAYDPMTAIMAARSKIRRAIMESKKEFTVPVYDGRRRTDLSFKIYGANKKGYIHISFSEIPVEGYTNSELKDIKEREAELHLYLDPKDLFPIAAKGESLIGTAYVRMQKECDTLAECIEASEE